MWVGPKKKINSILEDIRIILWIHKKSRIYNLGMLGYLDGRLDSRIFSSLHFYLLVLRQLFLVTNALFLQKCLNKIQ